MPLLFLVALTFVQACFGYLAARCASGTLMFSIAVEVVFAVLRLYVAFTMALLGIMAPFSCLWKLVFRGFAIYHHSRWQDRDCALW